MLDNFATYLIRDFIIRTLKTLTTLILLILAVWLVAGVILL